MDDRPQCTCEKTACLQRYCHCFEASWYCTDECSCHGCRNTSDNQTEVEEHADNIMRKKPDAFKPKIAASSGIDNVAAQAQHGAPSFSSVPPARTHVKGCNCRKSGCKKLYCECFKLHVGCTAKCHCVGCANKFGAKAGEGLIASKGTDNDSPNGTSDGSGRTTAGSNDGALSILGDEMYYLPTEPSVVDDFFATTADLDPCWSFDLGPIQAAGDGGLDMFLDHGDCSQHNVDPQTHEGFMQADESLHNSANSVLQQDPANPDICNVNKNGTPSGRNYLSKYYMYLDAF